ncbi:branched-chain amino acid transport system II carrier protein [bacterium LRH843]|nr:branched-chain amino acid transport system II carrier protein [bacterium LRH843]
MSFQKNLVIGLMLFAFFLGAGNIIFPPALGQLAGDKLVISMLGFLITGVGLPLVAVIAIAYSGGGLQTIASRVHPLFGAIFTMIIYLTIGPIFAIPRTATVSYEIGVAPFLQNSGGGMLALFTVIFFVVTLVLSLNPAKLVDSIGKVLTPILLIVIGVLALKSIITPMGGFNEAQGDYATHAFFRSFVEGYLTMDVLAALVFGIIIINAIRSEGITEKRAVLKAMIIAGVIAATGLTLVYFSLSYIGATSVDAIGIQENGATILTLSSIVLYGSAGAVILALTIIFACLTTAIGLVTSCAQYFHEVFPRLSYRTFVYIFTGVSTLIANVGLTQLIAFSVPVLLMIYPLAIVLMLLSFIDQLFDRKPIVYILALTATSFVSVFDGLKQVDIHVVAINKLISRLPFHEQQIGWLIPAVVGTLIGIVISSLFKKRK